MTFYRLGCIIIATCLAAIGSASTGASACCVQQAAIVTVQIDHAAAVLDPRLDKPVTLNLRGATLKSVLDQISSQTGIPITIDEHDPASGYQLLVVCDKLPAGRLMNALYGLFSIRRGEWAWNRVDTQGAYRYTLHETAWAKDRNAIYRGILDGLLRNYLAVLRELTPMAMDERKAHKSDLKKALLVDDDTLVDGLFNEPLFWTEASLFLSVMSPDQQADVLTGKSVSVTMNSLSQDAHCLYEQAFKDRVISTTNADGTETRLPPPEAILFVPMAPSVARKRLAPAVFMDLGPVSMSWMGTGSLEVGVRDAIKHAWMLPGDRTTDGASTVVVHEPTATTTLRNDQAVAAAALERFRNNSLPGIPERNREMILAGLVANLAAGPRLEELSLGSGTPVLAMLPSNDNHGYATPVGATVQGFLDRFASRSQDHFYKWRDGVLLISHPFWFTDPNSAISYYVLKMLLPDQHGRVPLRVWADFIGRISDDQAEWFAAAYGVDSMPKVTTCLRVINAIPAVLQKEGAPMTPEAMRLLISASILPRDLQATNGPYRLRMREPLHQQGVPSANGIAVEITGGSIEQWRAVALFQLPSMRAVPIATPPQQ